MDPREVTAQVRPQPHRFYDGGLLPGEATPGEPPDPTTAARIVLERHLEDGFERFSLGRRVAYEDRHLGELLVPADAGFRTDLTSVPTIFTWLVPRTGAHLPAALLHDGLVGGEDGASYVSTRGHVVDRVEADRVFRDAMADTGTGVVRRWVVWSAVTLATIVVPGGLPCAAPTVWRHRVVAALTLLLIAWLGWSATADLFDVDWPLAVGVPWMPEGSFRAEFVGGLCAAVVVPLLLGLTWGRFARAGMVGGVALATLLHVTVGVLAVSLGYRAVESLARRSPRLGWAVGGAAVVASCAGLAWALGR